MAGSRKASLEFVSVAAFLAQSKIGESREIRSESGLAPLEVSDGLFRASASSKLFSALSCQGSYDCAMSGAILVMAFANESGFASPAAVAIRPAINSERPGLAASIVRTEFSISAERALAE